MFGLKTRIARKNVADGRISAEKLDEVIAVCQNICDGNFESRVLHITTEEGPERTLCQKVNEMIDSLFALCRAKPLFPAD